MLDLKLIREQPEAVERALADKGGAALVQEVLARDTERRRLIRQVEDLNAERNRVSKEMGKKFAGGAVPTEVREQMRAVADQIKTLDAQLKDVDAAVQALALQIPNIPHPSVPPGKSDEDNVEVRRWGTPRDFAFTPRPHEEVGESLGLLDMDRAARIAACHDSTMWAPRKAIQRSPGTHMRHIVGPRDH